jgi:hypothetical protein
MCGGIMRLHVSRPSILLKEAHAPMLWVGRVDAQRALNGVRRAWDMHVDPVGIAAIERWRGRVE